MTDYTYPSVFFAYLFFALMFLLAVYFFIKTLRDGYWGEHSEDAKYRIFEPDDSERRKP